MKREYGPDELAVLKGIYDEGGEAALNRDEMRALRKAGLLTRDLPPAPEPEPEPEPDHPKEQAHPNTKPEVRRKVFDTIVRLAKTGDPTLRNIADELGMSRSGAHHHVAELVEEGLVARNPNGMGYILVDKTIEDIKGTSNRKEAGMAIKKTRTIAEALTGVYEEVSLLQRTAFQANDKVAYQYAVKLLSGELMDLKANYSKDSK